MNSYDQLDDINVNLNGSEIDPIVRKKENLIVSNEYYTFISKLQSSSLSYAKLLLKNC